MGREFKQYKQFLIVTKTVLLICKNQRCYQNQQIMSLDTCGKFFAWVYEVGSLNFAG
jgi:hypothetical protein